MSKEVELQNLEQQRDLKFDYCDYDDIEEILERIKILNKCINQ